MVKKKKEEHQHSCDGGKKYFYLFSSFVLIVLVILVVLFIGMKNGSLAVTGQAGSIPSLNPDTDFAQFKQCLCGAAKVETTPMTIIPVVPPLLNLPKAEICNNKQDDNNNAQIDCAEASCDGKDCIESNTAVSGICSQKLCVKKELNCHDGIDNDGDGKKDCDDLDCWEIDTKTLKNKCWQLPDNGAKKVDSVYLGLSGHYCQENKDCADGWCVAKHYGLPSVGSYCAPLCTGQGSCPNVYPGLSTTCKQITNTCPDCISICTSPYGAK